MCNAKVSLATLENNHLESYGLLQNAHTLANYTVLSMQSTKESFYHV